MLWARERLQVPTLSALPHTWTLKWVYKELGSASIFVAITYISNVQMSNANPFKTSKFQEFSNDIRNVSSHWVFTHAIALWRFESPLSLHLPSQSCLGSARVHSLTLSYIPRTWGVTLGLPLRPQPCNPFVLVTNPRLRLRHFFFHLNCHAMLKVDQYAIDYVKVC
jgi:hypothetical protein